MAHHSRLSALLELVTRRGSVTIAEISEALDVSAATARRDLSTLADQRLVVRTHGGATAIGPGYELPLEYKTSRNTAAKLAIARATAALVSPGQTVGLNGGTTTAAVARELGRSGRFALDDGEPGVTVVTNALNIAFELAPRGSVRTVVTGGVARQQSYELVGPVVRETLQNFVLDTAVLGVDGLSPQHGATTVRDTEAEVSRLLAEAARQVVVVADGSKLGRPTFARICDFAALDVLVTDEEPPTDVRDAAAEAAVEIVVAGPGTTEVAGSELQ
ncbi:DeoR/GlpR family DNA-binding transcription regulator [Luteimicrobium xylanilyticum]|uniref:HTH-type transcriptional regulator IolR n=1 Tax=Luteimicrobium xylanilyticum TaxID=1133546 RepID=A0A5P9QCG2_9MICO|nr:DeoR/GlpR family DNA-binding transcription regulator [Luteimicrobium xylanilyticum]QFU98792.1 HTH-type transcriptional regulator IolR [Luteimicrobium xylanilyticum]